MSYGSGIVFPPPTATRRLSEISGSDDDGAPAKSRFSGDCVLRATGLFLFRDAMFVIPFFANLFATVGLFIPFVYIVERAVANGVHESRAVLLLSVIGITNTLGRILMGFLADLEQVSALLLHNVALLSAGVACFLVRFCTVYWSMVIFALFIGLCIATWISLTSIVLCELLGLEKLANSFGLLSLTRGVASLIGPPIAGLAYDVTQNYDNSFLVASVMFLAGGAICCILHAPHFQRQTFAAQQQEEEQQLQANNNQTTTATTAK